MWHLPLRIDAVAVEPATDLVVDTSSSHRTKHRHTTVDGGLITAHHPLSHEVLQQAWVGKPRRLAEARGIWRVTVRSSLDATAEITLRNNAFKTPCGSLE